MENNDLPLCKEQLKKIDVSIFINELLDAVKYLSIFETKLLDTKLPDFIFLPKLELNEIVSSLKIEGTSTKIEDYYENQLLPIDQRSLETTELYNYINALDKGMRIVKIDGFTHENIKEFHKMLFCESKNIKKRITIGDYKKVNNYIGNDNKKSYIPPTFDKTLIYMDDLIDFMNDTDQTFHPLIKCAVMHAQFESIHPFEDGNGRLGRFLVPIYLCSTKLLRGPLFYISEAIEKDKFLYYRCLDETRNGDYNLWIKYFLQKCSIQSKKHIEFMNKIDSLYQKTTDNISNITNSVITPKIVNTIFKDPIISSKMMAESLSISLTQANRYLKCLEENKILYRNDKKRNVTYYFAELLSLID